MESVIKSLDKLVSHLEGQIKHVDYQIADAQDSIQRLRDEKQSLETKMYETAAAKDFLEKSRGEIKETAKVNKIEV